MLDMVAQIGAQYCKFEVLEGEWPKPVELPWNNPEPMLTMLFRAPSYRTEGRYTGISSNGFESIGNVFMTLPGHELYGRGTGGKVRAARCIFSHDLYRELMSEDSRLTHAQLQRALDLGNPTNSLLLKRLMQEAVSPGFASEVLVDSIASALLVDCARQILGHDADDDDSSGSGLHPRHLRSIEEYLETFETGMPQISELAKLCGFSSHYFAKLFRRTTGQSLGRYLAEWRIGRAEQLLVETDLPLKEIAYRLGFANAANFSTAFTKELNEPPGLFRRMRKARNCQRLQ